MHYPKSYQGRQFKMHSFFNPFPNKPWFLHVCSTNLFKSLLEKEKLLVTSNFSFSYSVFYPFEDLSPIFIEYEIVVCKLIQFGRVSNLSFGKGLTRIMAFFQLIFYPLSSTPQTSVGNRMRCSCFNLSVRNLHYIFLYTRTLSIEIMLLAMNMFIFLANFIKIMLCLCYV